MPHSLKHILAVPFRNQCQRAYRIYLYPLRGTLTENKADLARKLQFWAARSLSKKHSTAQP